MKREIFLSKLSMEEKRESISNMKKYLDRQEEELEKHVKLTEESKVVLKNFMQDEAKQLRLLKEKHLKMDETKQQLKEELGSVRNDIIDTDYELKRISGDIKVCHIVI